jgi:hypothetical protein
MMLFLARDLSRGKYSRAGRMCCLLFTHCAWVDCCLLLELPSLGRPPTCCFVVIELSTQNAHDHTVFIVRQNNNFFVNLVHHGHPCCSSVIDYFNIYNGYSRNPTMSHNNMLCNGGVLRCDVSILK